MPSVKDRLLSQSQWSGIMLFWGCNQVFRMVTMMMIGWGWIAVRLLRACNDDFRQRLQAGERSGSRRTARYPEAGSGPLG
jgi:hypothetical protein